MQRALVLLIASSPVALPVTALPVAALALPAVPQESQPEPLELRAPAYARDPRIYRDPGEEFALPDRLLSDLRQLRGFAERHRLTPGQHKTSFDADGRETSTDPAFRTLAEKLRPALVRQAGYLQKIVREHKDSQARQAAYYGAYFVPGVQETFHLIADLPAEPTRDTREDGLRLALPFLDRWLPTRGNAAAPPGDRGAAESEPGNEPLTLDLVPFIRLAHSRYASDRALALAALELVLRHRPSGGLPAAEVIHGSFVEGLRSPSKELLAASRSYLAVLAQDPAAGAGSPDELAARYGAALRKRLPLIRKISDGLIELHAGPERDEVVDAGRSALENGHFGAFGEIPPTHNRPETIRGIIVSPPTEKLKKLGFKPGDCIRSVNGVPAFTCRELLETLKTQIAAGMATFIVEYFSEGKNCAREFRVMR